MKIQFKEKIVAPEKILLESHLNDEGHFWVLVGKLKDTGQYLYFHNYDYRNKHSFRCCGWMPILFPSGLYHAENHCSEATTMNGVSIGQVALCYSTNFIEEEIEFFDKAIERACHRHRQVST